MWQEAGSFSCASYIQYVARGNSTFRGHSQTRSRSNSTRHISPVNPNAKTADVTVEKIFWAAGDSKFKMMACIDHETQREIVVKGHADVVEGDRLRVKDGKWAHDARYGWSFQIRKLDHADPTTDAGVRSYLLSLPGIGPALADAIIAKFGPNCLQKIDKDPSLLATVATVGGHGLSAAKLKQVAGQWVDERSKRAAMVYLGGLDLSEALAQRLHGAYGDDVVAILKQDPYRITEMPRIGFRLADRIARGAGIATDSPSRMAAGVEYTLEQAETSGHIYLSRPDLRERTRELLKLGAAATDAQLDDAIAAMVADKRLVVETFDGEERIYTAEFFQIETSIYERLSERLRFAPSTKVNPMRDPDADFQPTDEQWKAVENASMEPLSIMTGGPGSGKTMCLKAMVESLEAQCISYALAAPTGKAAKRMTETTRRPAQTLHKLMGFDNLMNGTPGKPMPRLPVRTLIVDEASMLDMRLAERLLASCGPETNVVLVGDPDQLPPVGAGSVFLDLISSERVPTARLTKVFRQGAGSLVLENARRVRDGKEPYWTKEEAEVDLGHPVREDWSFIEAPSAESAARIGVDTSARYHEDGVLVVSPTREGFAGVRTLNRLLQAEHNPRGEKLTKGDNEMRIGDTIMFNRNDYRLQVVNGDVGRITGYDKAAGVAHIALSEGEHREIGLSALTDLAQLGYALTVHKSQGSQAPHLVSTVTEGTGQRMLTRNLLYTAWTRAQSSCTVIGSKDAIRAAVAIDGSRRNTTLDLRVSTIRRRLDQRAKVTVTIGEALRRRAQLGVGNELDSSVAKSKRRHNPAFGHRPRIAASA